MQIAEYYDSVAPIWDDDYAEVILTGPTVTCCPELLDLGISRLSGRVITESDAMLKAIVEKRTSVNRFSVAYQVP